MKHVVLIEFVQPYVPTTLKQISVIHKADIEHQTSDQGWFVEYDIEIRKS